MTDFAFKIEGDASRANQAANTVLDRLEAIKRKAAEASQGMSFDKIAQGFSRLADAMKQEQAALARTTELHKQLTAAASPAAQAFGALGEAVRREQEMLDHVNGSAQRYATNLQTLDSLAARGKITTAQYAEQLGRLNRELAASRASPGSSGGSLGSLRQAAGAVGVGLGVREVFNLADSYQQLQNRLRFLANGDLGRVNALFGEMQQVAARTRSELGTTTEAVVKISMATKTLGLSQGEVVQFTERLNKTIKLSGASTAGADAAMLQLSQGLSAGALRGEEFNSVLENAPGILQVIAKQLGVTTGQLRLMAFDGKLTSDVIIEAFRKAGPEIDKSFGNTVPTISDSLVLFKNNATAAFGSLVEHTGVATGFGIAVKTAGDAVGALAGLFELADRALNGLGPALAAGAAAWGAYRLQMISARAVTGLVLGASIELGAYLGTKLAEYVDREMIAERKRNELLASAYEAYSAQTQAVIANLDAIHRDMLANEGLTETLQRTAQTIADGSVNFQTFTDVLLSSASALGRVTELMDRGQGILVDQNKQLTDATKKVEDYGAAITVLRTRLAQMGATGPDALKFLTSGDVKIIRDYQDAQEDQIDMTMRYGGVVNEIHKAERERKRALADLQDALLEGTINQKQFDDAVKKYIPSTTKAENAEKRRRLELEKLGRALLGVTPKVYDQKADFAAFQADIKRVVDEEIAQEERAYKYASEFAEAKAKAQRDWLEARNKAETEHAEKRIKAEHDLVEKSKEQAKQVQEAWAQGLGSIAADFVNMAAQGEFSMQKLGESLVKLALQVAAIQIGGPWGAALGSFAGGLNLTGHATGAQFMVGGSGGTDQNLVAFRASRDERVTVETQDDIRTGRYFGGGGPNVTVIANNNERDVIAAGGTYGAKRVFVQNQRSVGRRTR